LGQKGPADRGVFFGGSSGLFFLFDLLPQGACLFPKPGKLFEPERGPRQIFPEGMGFFPLAAFPFLAFLHAHIEMADLLGQISDPAVPFAKLAFKGQDPALLLLPCPETFGQGQARLVETFLQMELSLLRSGRGEVDYRPVKALGKIRRGQTTFLLSPSEEVFLDRGQASRFQNVEDGSGADGLPLGLQSADHVRNGIVAEAHEILLFS
jgi:hypothetical protein